MHANEQLSRPKDSKINLEGKKVFFSFDEQKIAQIDSKILRKTHSIRCIFHLGKTEVKKIKGR